MAGPIEQPRFVVGDRVRWSDPENDLPGYDGVIKEAMAEEPGCYYITTDSGEELGAFDWELTKVAAPVHAVVDPREDDGLEHTCNELCDPPVTPSHAMRSVQLGAEVDEVRRVSAATVAKLEMRVTDLAEVVSKEREARLEAEAKSQRQYDYNVEQVARIAALEEVLEAVRQFLRALEKDGVWEASNLLVRITTVLEQKS